MTVAVRFSGLAFRVAVIALLSFPAFRAFGIPAVISYQGCLKDSDGNPITTAVDVTFTFWDAPSIGNQIGSFSDTDSVTPSAEGLFTTLIGDDPGTAIPPTVFSSDSVWLNVNVGGTNLRPRTRMVSTGYAFQAQSAADADTVDRMHAADLAPAIHEHTFKGILGTVADAQIVSSLTRDTELATGLATKADATHTHGKSDLHNSGALSFVWGNSEVVDALTISGGTVNNTPIGANTPSTGAFTSLGATGNTTLGDASGDQVTVNGALRIASGSPAADRVLTSDASGNATWQTNDADLLDGSHASAFQRHYSNVKVVAKSGGDYTTIGDALAAITTASSSNHFLVYVAPGTYNERVIMKAHVDIEGAGELATRILYEGGLTKANGFTVSGDANAELRNLTVENSGGATYGVAVYNDASVFRITNVRAVASGATSAHTGIYNVGSIILTHVKVEATGGSSADGIENDSATGLFMRDVSVVASGSTTLCRGFLNRECTVTLVDCSISASGAPLNYGIHNTAGSGTFGVVVRDSQIIGSSYTILNDSEFTVLVGASQLGGGTVSAGGGTCTCAGVYDENFTFHASTCP